MIGERGSGRRFPIQEVPAAPFDQTEEKTVALILCDLAPNQELRLEPEQEAFTPPDAARNDYPRANGTEDLGHVLTKRLGHR